jgi:hypothetical protein
MIMIKTKTVLQIILTFSLIFNTNCQTIPQSNQGQNIKLRSITLIPSVLKESSGIVAKNRNSIWSHNDSGNSNDLFLFDSTGNLLRTIRVSNISNIDWEDLATDNEGRIYINDAGNNNNDRTDLAIHIIPNPDSFQGNQIQATSINFAFEDQTAFPPPASKRNFDIEGIIWHNDSIVMFTKNRSTPLDGYCKMYKIPAMAGNYTAKLIDSIFLGNTNNDARVTAAAIRRETGEMVLLTRSRVLSFHQYSGGNFFNGEMTIYPFVDLPGQAEAIDFVSDNVVYITEEGSSNQSGYLYEAVLREASGTNEEKFRTSSLIKKIFNHTLFVSLRNEQTEIENIKIIDLKGITVSLSDSKNDQLSIAGLKAGIYILQVATKNGFIIEKIFINE